jgi:hypothetical protein
MLSHGTTQKRGNMWYETRRARYKGQMIAGLVVGGLLYAVWGIVAAVRYLIAFISF